MSWSILRRSESFLDNIYESVRSVAKGLCPFLKKLMRRSMGANSRRTFNFLILRIALRWLTPMLIHRKSQGFLCDRNVRFLAKHLWKGWCNIFFVGRKPFRVSFGMRTVRGSLFLRSNVFGHLRILNLKYGIIFKFYDLWWRNARALEALPNMYSGNWLYSQPLMSFGILILDVQHWQNRIAITGKNFDKRDEWRFWSARCNVEISKTVNWFASVMWTWNVRKSTSSSSRPTQVSSVMFCEPEALKAAGSPAKIWESWFVGSRYVRCIFWRACIRFQLHQGMVRFEYKMLIL